MTAIDPTDERAEWEGGYPEDAEDDWPEGCRCTIDSLGARTTRGCPHHTACGRCGANHHEGAPPCQ